MIILLVLAMAAGAYVLHHYLPRPPAPAPRSGAKPDALTEEVARLESREKHLNETVWRTERLAEQYGRTFDDLWDAINAATNKLAVLDSVPFSRLVLPLYQPPTDVGAGVQLFHPAGKDRELVGGDWPSYIRKWQALGWRLDRVEFRHVRFEPPAPTRAAQSRFAFSAHLTNEKQPQRMILDGHLAVTWATNPGSQSLGAMALVDASEVMIKLRAGEPGFQLTLDVDVPPSPRSGSIDPLILYDLDGDGLSEIILAAANLVARRQPDGLFSVGPLCPDLADPTILSGLIADFDGDGSADLLAAHQRSLILFPGSPRGTFAGAGRSVWAPPVPLHNPHVLTCGDVEGDGDLDVWLAQYKPPYQHGQMPRPFHDANDGFPSYLLLNLGDGTFRDGTGGSGLEKKRWRRTYSASFVHLNDDPFTDLAVVSDFAGVDLYRNDGGGRFTDVTASWSGEPRAFGMAHCFADFDTDGRSDLLVIGMNSPTADRLSGLGLVRPDADDAQARTAMTFGNRLFRSRSDGAWEQNALGASISRSGWAWGCAAMDFDNDSFPDVYIANGHDNRRSVREYEPEFWLHDLYVADSRESEVASRYFDRKVQRRRDAGDSYGGYEKNRFYWNQRGEVFLEVGHLMGVALEECSRNVVADDLDGDGRVDLLTTTLQTWPIPRQTLKFYRNVLTQSGNWIGIRLKEQGPASSPVGARITVRAQNHESVRHIVTGDSYRSQTANTVHFGLGPASVVDSLTVRWANGRTIQIQHPAVNQYHVIE